MSDHMTDREYEASGDVKNAAHETDALERSDAAKVAAVAALGKNWLRLSAVAMDREAREWTEAAGKSVLQALSDPDAALAAVRAEAWDEGARAAGGYGHEDGWTHDMNPFDDNPYRAKAVQS